MSYFQIAMTGIGLVKLVVLLVGIGVAVVIAGVAVLLVLNLMGGADTPKQPVPVALSVGLEAAGTGTTVAVYRLWSDGRVDRTSSHSSTKTAVKAGRP